MAAVTSIEVRTVKDLREYINTLPDDTRIEFYSAHPSYAFEKVRSMIYLYDTRIGSRLILSSVILKFEPRDPASEWRLAATAPII